MSLLITALLLHQFFHGLIDREAAGLLPRWKLLECCEMLPDDRLRRDQYKQVLNEPFVIGACFVFRALERSDRRLKILGARNGTKGCIQTSKPCAFCSMNTAFQLPKRSATRSPSAERPRCPAVLSWPGAARSRGGGRA